MKKKCLIKVILGDLEDAGIKPPHPMAGIGLNQIHCRIVMLKSVSAPMNKNDEDMSTSFNMILIVYRSRF